MKNKQFRKLLIFSFVFALFCNTILAQESYFQQRVDYTIHVKLDDNKDILKGQLAFLYQNNSPDTLKYIYIHLWPNGYKDQKTGLAKQLKKQDPKTYKMLASPKNRGYIKRLNFQAKGESLQLQPDAVHQDIARLLLNEPLFPGEKIRITTPFEVKIPMLGISRMGHKGQFYAITQWYPKPAVYDNEGWHAMPYLDMGEFYSEFGSFEVYITVPSNYVVAATGNLQTASELAWLNQKAKQTATIEKFNRNDMITPASDGRTKTLHYTESNIHDFAWFADKRFHVLKDTVTLKSGKHVNTWAFFTNDKGEGWKKANTYINDALSYYSKWYGEYPYNNCTAIASPGFGAGGGMEYPTITNIGPTNNDFNLEMVIMHEVGHNWFYGMLGFNERRHPWLDEGINSFSETRYMYEKYGKEAKLYKLIAKKPEIEKYLGIGHLTYPNYHELYYLFLSSLNRDMPANLPSESYNWENYGGIIYSKTSRIFWHLFHYMGSKEFDNAMSAFFKKWQYKHPGPGDLRNHFETYTNKDLSWLFNDMLTTTKTMDYKIAAKRKDKILIKNNGKISAPFPIIATVDDSIVFKRWEPGFSKRQWITLPNIEADRWVIDPLSQTMEVNRQNNTIRNKGLAKKIEPLSFIPNNFINRPNKTQIGILPAIGWNSHNGAMVGTYLYSSFFPLNGLSYDLIPLYGIGNNGFAGLGRLNYPIFLRSNVLEAIDLSVSGKQFAFSNKTDAYYQKGTATIAIDFVEKNGNKTDNKLTLSYSYVTDFSSLDNNLNLFTGDFTHSRQLWQNPLTASLSAEKHPEFTKLKLNIRYKKKDKFKVRLFAGTFLEKNENLPLYYAFRLSGTSGFEDYAFNHLLTGRGLNPHENPPSLWSRQFVRDQGGFVPYTHIGATRTFMSAINADVALLGSPIMGLQAYLNIAYYDQGLRLGYDIGSVAWDFGAKVSFFSDTMELFFPIGMSRFIRDDQEVHYDNYGERIRFTLNLKQINPRKLLRNAL